MATETDAEINVECITFTELAGLQQLAAVARCCQTHALSPEVQAALEWIADCEDTAKTLLGPAEIAPLQFTCTIDDPTGSTVASGSTEQQAVSRAHARFVEDFGRAPSDAADVSTRRRSE